MVTISYNLSKAQAMEFLNKLATDDEFRNQLIREPSSTLQRYGILIPQENVPTFQLPPKEEVTAWIRYIQYGGKCQYPKVGYG